MTSKSTDIMKKVLYIAGSLGAIASGITGYSHIKESFRESFHEEVHDAVQEHVNDIEKGYNKLHTLHYKDSMALIKFMDTKSSTFAVGLRVDKDNKLYYRAENGSLYRAYKDIQMSVDYNYPYFYYIDGQDSNKKKWCK